MPLTLNSLEASFEKQNVNVLHFMTTKSLGSFCPVTCLKLPQDLGSQQCSWGLQLPVRETSLDKLSWGGAFTRERPRYVGSQSSPKLTDQFFHPLRCLPGNGYLPHAAETKKHLRCTHLCQSLLASGFHLYLSKNLHWRCHGSAAF